MSQNNDEICTQTGDNVQAPIIAHGSTFAQQVCGAAYAIYFFIDFHCRVSVCDISRVYTFDAVRCQ